MRRRLGEVAHIQACTETAAGGLSPDRHLSRVFRRLLWKGVPLSRLGKCWAKHTLLLWGFAEPLKHSLCCDAVGGWGVGGLAPFHLFFHLANVSWDLDGLWAVLCRLTVGRSARVPTACLGSVANTMGVPVSLIGGTVGSIWI